MTNLKVIKNFTIYQEDEAYVGFPSIIKLQNGGLYLTFRHVPDWSKTYLLKGNHNHVDMAAKEVYLTSPDGINWPSKAKTLYNHLVSVQ
jgi:hypothetical protein